MYGLVMLHRFNLWVIGRKFVTVNISSQIQAVLGQSFLLVEVVQKFIMLSIRLKTIFLRHQRLQMDVR